MFESCNGCSQRKVGCHSTCKTHKKDKFKYELMKRRIKNAKATDNAMVDRILEKNDKRAKRTKGKRVGQK